MAKHPLMKVPDEFLSAIPESLASRDVSGLGIFSIAGWFENHCFNGTATMFGGYFRADSSDSFAGDGFLVDMYGDATIEGTMNKTKFSFKKQYTGRTDRIYYKFVLNPDTKVWEGEYEGRSTARGRAQCITTKVMGNGAFQVVSGPVRGL